MLRTSSAFPLALLAFATLGCFRLTGPEDPPPLGAALVSVTVQYRQPNGCLNLATPCDEPVVFFGSWMPAGAEFRLTRDPGTFMWRGVAHGVPVNWPPRDDPHRVWIFDPHLRESLSQGISADRIVLGGEALTRWDGGGGPQQHALAFVDQDGRGHNPY